jgi:hypothetical protein
VEGEITYLLERGNALVVVAAERLELSFLGRVEMLGVLRPLVHRLDLGELRLEEVAPGVLNEASQLGRAAEVTHWVRRRAPSRSDGPGTRRGGVVRRVGGSFHQLACLFRKRIIEVLAKDWWLQICSKSVSASSIRLVLASS